MAVFGFKSGASVACYHPIRAYHGRHGGIVFSESGARTGIELSIPCGQCVGCRLERSRQWALRIVQEMRCHTESAFLTLTYDDRHLPEYGSLVLRDLQLFMKRLRKRRAQGLRFYACGEYGELNRRPHYHVLLLNTSFSDQLFWKRSGDHSLYVSAECRSLWTQGEHFIGGVTFQSAAYVARYCVKKITGEKAAAHYGNRIPEFTCMSRRPGIGYDWFRHYGEHAYKRDSCVSQGHEVALPRYYDSKFERDGNYSDIRTRETRLQRLKVIRRRKVDRKNNTPARLEVRERVDELKMEAFKRDF